jgi:spore coat polysaccharide biosynthesis predicted glycosyltransferase SpsG
VFFRVDSFIFIGSGNVMRCIRIAQKLKKKVQTAVLSAKILPSHVEKGGALYDIIMMEMRKGIWVSRQAKFGSYVASFEG